MKQNEWLAIAVGLGLFVLLYITQMQPRNLFYGYPTEWWVIVPVAIAFIVYRWDSIFKIAEQKPKLEHPERIVSMLMSEPGQEFREKHDILSFTEFQRPMLYKGGLYRFQMHDRINGDRLLIANALKGGDPIFFSIYKQGEWAMAGFNSEKEYINQILPKDKPSLLDILEELPEEAKVGYAMRQSKEEETK